LASAGGYATGRWFVVLRQFVRLCVAFAVAGLIFAQMAGTICAIGLADALGGDEQASVGSLARRLGCDEGVLFRLVRALAAQGILTIDAGKMVGHSGASRLLRRGLGM
jgi:hypothetical protein